MAWAEVARIRTELADTFEELEPDDWDTASWCTGWRVRDVLAHLVWGAESTPASLARDLWRVGGRPDRAVDRAARRLGRESVPELTGRLRAAADKHYVPDVLAAFPLADVIVHSADALGPLDRDIEVAAETVVPLLDVYRRAGRTVVHASPARGRRLVATDVDWMRGNGPEIRGRAVDLLLYLANRRQAASRLSGPTR
jgi:uncharacterized protein (TIGR03083 family)